MRRQRFSKYILHLIPR